MDLFLHVFGALPTRLATAAMDVFSEMPLSLAFSGRLRRSWSVRVTVSSMLTLSHGQCTLFW